MRRANQSEDLHLPLIGDQERAFLQQMLDTGCVNASPETDVFEQLDYLVDQGFCMDMKCEEACGVHTFQITRAGRTVLESIR